MAIWSLLKRYIKDVETTNHLKFSNDAWQRIKQLEQDIIADNRIELNERLQIEREQQATIARLQADYDAARAALEAALVIFDNPNRANFGDAVRILRQAADALKRAGSGETT